MNIKSAKTFLSLTCFSALSLSLLSCGGSGSDRVPEDDLPVGSTLSLIMPQSTTPFMLTMDVLGGGYGNIMWNSKSGMSTGTAAFSYRRNGTSAVFATSFTYADGTFIVPGPVIITTYVAASVTATLSLPDDLDSQTYQKGISGVCSYDVYLETYGNPTQEVPGAYSGSGTYEIEPTNR